MDPYWPFSRVDMDWLTRLLESYIEDHPEDILDVGRGRAGLTLELPFKVAPRSRRVFTETVCLEIAEAVAARTGATAPVLYVYGDPHLAAREVLERIERGE